MHLKILVYLTVVSSTWGEYDLYLSFGFFVLPDTCISAVIDQEGSSSKFFTHFESTNKFVSWRFYYYSWSVSFSHKPFAFIFSSIWICVSANTVTFIAFDLTDIFVFAEPSPLDFDSGLKWT